MKKTASFPSPPCPCGSQHSYAACCEPWHRGEPAPTAEALMRSRYSAYVLQRKDYLLATWHPDTRPARIDEDNDGEVGSEGNVGAGTPPTRWLGLTVKRHQQQDADHATVEFVARYRVGGRGHRLHETSHFVREGGRWYYLDGELA